MDKTSENVLFVNTAAKQFSVKANESFNMSVAGAAEKIGINAMCF